MWQYWWPHVIYHTIRWFPKNNRRKIRVLLLLFTVGFLVPQLWVLVQPHSERFCPQRLLELLIVSIVFTFFMMGFSFLFSIMEPVPQRLKMLFHVFGVVCFVTSLITTTLSLLAEDCRNTTEELYWFFISATIFTLISMAFFAIMLPFWIVNQLRKNSVLSYRQRSGVCYEPVLCCPCLWHITDDWTEKQQQYSRLEDLHEM